MAWQFELIAGPFESAAGGVVWNGQSVIFSIIDEGRLLQFDPQTGKTAELRRYTNRVNGLARGPGGELYGAQEGGRRLVEFTPDGRVMAVDALLDGKYHNQPSDLVVDKTHRIWFTDPHHPAMPFGPAIFPFLEHASVLRFERNDHRAWIVKRVTIDTTEPRALLLSPDERTLYVADGGPSSNRARELRAYPIRDDGSVGSHTLLHSFGSDYCGPHRGIEGLCASADGNIVACGGWQRSGPGPLIYVFAPDGHIIETHRFPADMPNRCCFAGNDTLYVTTGGGHLYRAKI
jgi:gluconolactonase